MYKRILVPLDGSTLGGQTLPYVRVIGSALNCPVELIRIFEVDPYITPYVAYPTRVIFQEQAKAAADHREEVMHSLEPISNTLSGAGLNVTARVLEPHAPGSGPSSSITKEVATGPAHHIIEEAEREADTLIVMCTHGRSGIGRWVLGSVADKVLHAATNPLLLVRGQPEESAPADASIDSIIVPWDGSGVAEQIWPHAVALSQAFGVKVHLVNVIPEDRSHALEEDQLRRVGDRLVQDGAHSYDTSLVHGDPAQAIVDMTEQFPQSIVAMTTHGRSGVGRWVMGSVTDRVVRYAAGPVLVTRAQHHS